MKLRQLLDGVDCRIIGNKDAEIKSLTYDSRKAGPDALFFCIKGYSVDGHKFALTAVEKGASCIVVSEPQETDATQIVVKDTREAMALIAANFYGRPADKLTMIGVTGTNGKTTTTYMLKKILESDGRKVGLIGTIERIVGNVHFSSERTTPESLDLQRILKEMLDAGCDSVVMEVSSHSLYLKRVFGITFNGSIFTNLTQDHLDFHKTMTEYANAKALLFANSKISVINSDDPYSETMMKTALNYTTFGIGNNSAYKAENIDLSEKGSYFTLVHNNKSTPIALKIPGLFNVMNALGAVSVCVELGIDISVAQQGIEQIENVFGRFQRLDTYGQGFSVILDYSHTPDSLENAIKTVKGFAKGRVVCVFGCGGNRDSLKRPIMGEISGKNADFTIITSDNPRFEHPCDIIAQILTGIKKTNGKYITIDDRREAIKYALKNAEKNDVILLAGKGHEDYQEIKGIKYAFDEKVIVEELMNELFSI